MLFKQKKELPQFPLMDSQVNLVVKDYYSDESFLQKRFWQYKLMEAIHPFTGANNMSYIDSFLDRGVGCQQFTNGLKQAIGENKHHWFVS